MNRPAVVPLPRVCKKQEVIGLEEMISQASRTPLQPDMVLETRVKRFNNIDAVASNVQQ